MNWLTCCGAAMVKVPPQAWDPTGTWLAHCRECGHVEPWDDEPADIEDSPVRSCGHAREDWADDCPF